jgi:AbrB family looped-hinge helix DNA binding protein
MQTKMSSKGQVVLPVPLRRKLGLRSGDTLDVAVESGRIVLFPPQRHSRKPRIVTDPVLGIPVLTFGPDAPSLTSEEVEEILANFP